ncbi:hypothetical protein BGZ83_010094 [Gryganskiella cystojenkinii]|nr:hypothetical protein BGZ83_010094 [Gryganskiella cystojenkinii]
MADKQPLTQPLSTDIVQHALDIPELLASIASQLQGDRPAIMNCCLVSKAFKDAFLPLFWSDIRIPSREHHPLPPVSAVRTHAALVRTLGYYWWRRGKPYTTEYATISFPNLKKLVLKDEDWYSNGNTSPCILEDSLWRHHGALQELKLTHCRSISAPAEQSKHWRILLSLVHDHYCHYRLYHNKYHCHRYSFSDYFLGLQRLKLHSLQWTCKEAIPIFWKTILIRSLEELVLEYCTVWLLVESESESEDPEQGDEPRDPESSNSSNNDNDKNNGHNNVDDNITWRLRRLHLENNEFDRPYLDRILSLVARSPQLESLHWSGFRKDTDPDDLEKYSVELLMNAIETTESRSDEFCWPRLMELNLCESDLSDARMEETLRRRLAPLERLMVRRSPFGERSCRALIQCHGQTLTHLDLSSCQNVTSSSLQSILCTCSRLIDIRTLSFTLSTSDVVRRERAQDGEKGEKEEEGDEDENETEVGVHQGRPWVCRGLRRWWIDVLVNSEDKEEGYREIVSRLKGFKRLSSLSLHLSGLEHYHELTLDDVR